MGNLKNTQVLVKQILEEEPITRNSDDELYVSVCKRINKDSVSMPFYLFMQNRGKNGLPPFESVRRSRQKVQEIYPELKANEEVEIWRNLNEEYYRRFARSEMV